MRTPDPVDTLIASVAEQADHWRDKARRETDDRLAQIFERHAQWCDAQLKQLAKKIKTQ